MMELDPDDTMPAQVASAVAGLTRAPIEAPELVARVMDAVRLRQRRLRRIRFASVAAGIAAAVLLGVVIDARLAPRPRAAADTGAGTAGTAGTNDTAGTAVRFALHAPGVRTLALVGDFNSWNARATPMTRDAATGTWLVRLRLPEGHYLYAFVADGAQWIADPRAPHGSADDFAHPNSVLVVNAQFAAATLP